jgi:hypothetical protein
MTGQNSPRPIVLAFLISLVFAGCPKPLPFPPNPRPMADADLYTCADACKHGFDLDCEFARPTPKGQTCLDVCGNVQQSGIIMWNLSCMSTASTCPAIERCN